MTRRAFSLLEVVIAVGVFASAIVVILALLPALAKEAAASADALAAQRLPDALRVELQRVAGAGGFETLAANVPVLHAPLGNGLAFVASRDAARLHSEAYLAPAPADAIPEREKYFLVEVWRFPAAPLAYDASGTVLPVLVRVSWPHRVAANGSPVDWASRSSLTFSTAINR